jgi:hypothetical protein
MSDDLDIDPHRHVERVERLAAMFLAALIAQDTDMSVRDEVKLAVTYAEMLIVKLEEEYEQ